MREDGSTALEAQGDKPLLRNWKFQKALTADPDLSTAAKAVAFVLLDIHNNDDGFARPGHKRIAQRAGSNVSTVKRALASLKERGWFCIAASQTEAGDQDTNRYYPIWKRAEGQAPTGSERRKKAQTDTSVREEAQTSTDYEDDQVAFAFRVGPARFTEGQIDVLKTKLGASYPEFIRKVESQAATWPEKGWEKRANAIFDDLMEPMPF